MEITPLQKLEAIYLLTFEVEYAIEQPIPSSAAPFGAVWDCLPIVSLKETFGMCSSWVCEILVFCLG